MEKIIEIVKNSKTPMSAQEVTKKLGFGYNETAMVKKMLERFVKEGKIIKKNGRYTSNKEYLEGKVCSTISGADFFVSEKLTEDLKIVKSREFCLMHNDTVLVKRTGKNCQAVSIIKRGYERIVGTVYRDDTTLYVAPDEKKLHELFILPKSKKNGAREGDKVVADIISYPTEKAHGVCAVTEVLGSAEEDSTAILSVLYNYGISENFPSKVIDALQYIPDKIEENDLYNRLDLRKLNIITIDGDDAKDLDDAVSLEITEKGDYLLGVHIADVSHYVKMDSSVDVEARTRATSVYIPGKVFPMLPKELSNGICSLNEGEDRLTISCFMVISKQGKVMEYSIQPSIINSKHRMTYNELTELLEDPKSEKRKQYKDVFGMLLLMKNLAMVLIDNAQKRGSIDFDLPEAKIILDENDFPIEIKEYEIGISNRIIEQFMLITNQTVASHMLKNSLPSIYRVHEPPEEKKLEAFKDLINVFGYRLPQSPKPQDFQKILLEAEGTDEEALIKKTMLRSMSKAKYKATCDGHFGLSYEHYLHFTSPIRRYPDLMVHRALNMTFEKNKKALFELEKRIENCASVSTTQEINAAMCERDVEDIRKAQYMEKRIGEEFFGTISGVTAYGMFVELQNTVEGFIPINTIDGYFDYDEARYQLKSDEKTFRLGDKVNIRVFAVNIPDGKVEFTLLA